MILLNTCYKISHKLPKYLSARFLELTNNYKDQMDIGHREIYSLYRFGAAVFGIDINNNKTWKNL